MLVFLYFCILGAKSGVISSESPSNSSIPHISNANNVVQTVFSTFTYGTCKLYIIVLYFQF